MNSFNYRDNVDVVLKKALSASTKLLVVMDAYLEDALELILKKMTLENEELKVNDQSNQLLTEACNLRYAARVAKENLQHISDRLKDDKMRERKKPK